MPTPGVTCTVGHHVVAKRVNATLATGFFYYLTNFFRFYSVFYTIPLPLGAHGAPLELRYGQLFAMALILFLAGVNYFGVKLGGEIEL